ncbi:MAG: DUF302 domain-containing protein [Anaerolineales bacterium]|nr:MAG: DUF302 domain-containing protein [Anaerolineales bacterium]
MSEEIGFEIKLLLSYEDALNKTVEALKDEGFGVLTKIDVQATLKEKLGQEFRPYSILGACNPPLAHRALTQDPVVGLMLPCNVTVEAVASNETMVRIANPQVMLQVGTLQKDEVLAEIATEARLRLERVAKALLDNKIK